MDKTKALQKLLNGTATKKEIELLKQALASGEIAIGGDVNRSVVIIGSGNKVELTSEALCLLKPETTSAEPAEGEPPYMGLRYFDTSDADLFYGREALTRELFARVQKGYFLAIVGASGSGKSSVARAGLIPAWAKENERGAIHVITPTTHPLESLAASLTRASESVTATSTLMDDMKNDSRSLRLYVRKILSSLGKPNALLVVDQFEETFTLCKDPDERKSFIENLLAAADEDEGRVHVVITLRADFYAHCFEFEGLRLALEKYQANIGAMSPDELRQAITAPAQSAGWDFQPGLVDLILRDVGTEPGALPLLSQALLETWKRRHGHTLNLQGYQKAGRVQDAIARTAESVYDKLTPAEKDIARSIFLLLTEPGKDALDTRRRVKMEELAQGKEQELVTKVLKTLTDARLVTTEQDSAEVAHEALIREWGTLRKWLDENRENLLIHRQLTESAQEWKRKEKEVSELYRGARLEKIQNWTKEHDEQLSPIEEEFVKASQNVKKLEYMRMFAAPCVLFALMVILMVIVIQMKIVNRFLYKPVDMEDYWVTIPAGEFQMGNEGGANNQKPLHTVYLGGFQIGKYEVTKKQYNQCVGAGVCTGAVVTDRLDHPVNVTWLQAKAYCEWVGGRLPTEAEWEKAASWDDKAKTKRVYPWGDNIDSSFANYNKDYKADYCDASQLVGSYKDGISPYGLFDMAGNVWEWTSSLFQPYPYDVNDGREDLNNVGDRVIRGGSWFDFDDLVRSSFRSHSDLSKISNVIGFRCARSP